MKARSNGPSAASGRHNQGERFALDSDGRETRSDRPETIRCNLAFTLVDQVFLS
jgi:hypothetical protein